MTREQYRAFLKQNGATQRERIVNKAIYDAKRLGPISPSYKKVTIDGVSQYVNVISTAVVNQKTIHSQPGEDFSIGSIVVLGNSHWLITERDFEDEITVRGRIQICQKEIIQQDSDTLEIRSLWATVEKPYYSNLKENNSIGYSTREFRIQMPFDDYSSKLNVGKRLMLEVINGVPKTYRVTSVDQMTGRIDYKNEQVGFLSFNVEQDLYNPETDNLEKMICNYIPVPEKEDTPEKPVPPPVPELKIMFNGEPTIRTGGIGKSFTASINGVEGEPVVEWSLVGKAVPFGVHFKSAAANASAQKCMIVAEDDIDLIGVAVELKATYKEFTSSVNLEVI